MVEDEEPGTQDQKTAGEGDEARRIEEVEHAAGESEKRKRANATRTPRPGARKELLEGQAEKKAQGEE
jgi:hypothetical protein